MTRLPSISHRLITRRGFRRLPTAIASLTIASLAATAVLTACSHDHAAKASSHADPAPKASSQADPLVLAWIENGRVKFFADDRVQSAPMAWEERESTPTPIAWLGDRRHLIAVTYVASQGSSKSTDDIHSLDTVTGADATQPCAACDVAVGGQSDGPVVALTPTGEIVRYDASLHTLATSQLNVASIHGRSSTPGGAPVDVIGAAPDGFWGTVADADHLVVNLYFVPWDGTAQLAGTLPWTDAEPYLPMTATTADGTLAVLQLAGGSTGCKQGLALAIGDPKTRTTHRVALDPLRSQFGALPIGLLFDTEGAVYVNAGSKGGSPGGFHCPGTPAPPSELLRVSGSNVTVVNPGSVSLTTWYGAGLKIVGTPAAPGTDEDLLALEEMVGDRQTPLAARAGSIVTSPLVVTGHASSTPAAGGG
ncbi:MAG: hypothetical protein HOW97_27365 [Catenulispora sp.]|nr:hypothetical protein [Catenulispora sp.]